MLDRIQRYEPSRRYARGKFFTRLAAISALLVSGLAAQPLHARTSLPNVVVLLSDDLGWKDIGCYGGPVKTPTLDRLAANGVRFTNFYSGAPVCSTARATLLTGRHHLRTGVYTVIQDHLHHMHLRKSEVTIAETLRTNGYETVHLGKWHVGTPFRGWKKPWIDEHGFQYWFATDLNAAPSHRDPSNFWRNRERVGDLDGFACQLVVDEAIHWLDQKRDSEKPFFLNLWFHEPHAPLAAPDDIVAEYGEQGDPAAIYSATIDNTDRAIARLMKTLEMTGSLENTIIIYTSDHGSYRHERNGGLRNGKGSLLEGGIRVPGIIHWPKAIEGGRVEDTPAGALDILPTICGLVGIEKPEGVQLDGVDLRPLLTGGQTSLERHQPLTWHSPTSQPSVVIRDGKYSLVGWRDAEFPKDQNAIREVMDRMRVILEERNGRKMSRQELWHQCYNSPLNTPEWNQLRQTFVTLNTFQESWIPLIKSGVGGISKFELYDLSNDPGQQHNIADQFPDITNRLKQTVLAINAEVLDEAPLWGTHAQVKESLQVHRLESRQRSAFDAFVYLNRIPVEPEGAETEDDLSGRILGRLANQEGRVLVKLPPGMNRLAYEGFKIALDSGTELHSGRCVSCHRLPDLKQTSSIPPIPSLRGRHPSRDQLREAIDNETHRDIQLDENDLQRLHAWMQTLDDVSDREFRNLILRATVLDTSGALE